MLLFRDLLGNRLDPLGLTPQRQLLRALIDFRVYMRLTRLKAPQAPIKFLLEVAYSGWDSQNQIIIIDFFFLILLELD